MLHYLLLLVILVILLLCISNEEFTVKTYDEDLDKLLTLKKEQLIEDDKFRGKIRTPVQRTVFLNDITKQHREDEKKLENLKDRLRKADVQLYNTLSQDLKTDSIPSSMADHVNQFQSYWRQINHIPATFGNVHNYSWKPHISRWHKKHMS